MATVTLNPDILVESGLLPTNNGGLSTGNTYKFRNNGKTLLRINNAGGSPCTVTITAQKQIGAHTVSNETVAVAAGGEQFIGPFQKDIYNDVNGDVSFTLSFVTSVTVAVLQQP